MEFPLQSVWFYFSVWLRLIWKNPKTESTARLGSYLEKLLFFLINNFIVHFHTWVITVNCSSGEKDFFSSPSPGGFSEAKQFTSRFGERWAQERPAESFFLSSYERAATTRSSCRLKHVDEWIVGANCWACAASHWCSCTLASECSRQNSPAPLGAWFVSCTCCLEMRKSTRKGVEKSDPALTIFRFNYELTAVATILGLWLMVATRSYLGTSQLRARNEHAYESFIDKAARVMSSTSSCDFGKKKLVHSWNSSLPQ